jgi:membrane protein implicated in regulation of membrane protease activity
MSDETKRKGPGAIWRDQPEEKLTLNLEQIVNRRTERLYSSTRSEILMSVGAALLLAGVVAWRIAPAQDPLQELGFAAVIAWVVISLYRFRHRIGRRDPVRPDAAATGLEYYRNVLERRRDHLRNAWLWHGPLFLACMILIAIWTGTWTGSTFYAFHSLRNVLPLVVLLAVWTGFGFWRRRLQAKELQREIDEIEPIGTAER